MLVCGMLKDKKKQRMEARQQGRAQATEASRRGFLEKDEAAVTQMLGWVTRLMQAAMHDESKIPSLLSEAHQLRPGAVAVQVTGGGVALATRWIWESLDMARQKRRIQLLKTWRIKIREEVSAVKALAGKALLPAGTKKSQLLQSNWTEKLNEIIAFFKTVESQDEATRIHSSRLGIRLFLAGFKAIDELAGLPMSALPKLTTNPREQAMLARAVQDLDDLAAQARIQKIRSSLGVKDPQARGPRSAEQLAITLTPEELARLSESNRELEGILDLKIAAGPRAATDQLAAARSSGQGEQVKALLSQRELQLRLAQQRKSLPQVASGLRCWHGFATRVLGYSEEATLPPESASDVCSWLTIFQNADTAATYLSHLRWACREFHKNLLWNESSIASLLKSMRKEDLLTRVANLPEGIRFTEENMFKLTLLAWEMGDPEFGMLCTLAYHFLLRVPSEGLPLEAGTPGELLAPLPEGRHSAVAVVEGRLHMRLRSRKNRPQGSILVRECCCKALQEPRLCPVHCYDWENQVGGTRLFTYSAMAAKMRLRRFASLLGCQERNRSR